jgi:hypothetical protein
VKGMPMLGRRLQLFVISNQFRTYLVAQKKKPQFDGGKTGFIWCDISEIKFTRPPREEQSRSYVTP